jgi:4-carboxymuconolactone decarboxylase
MTTSLHEGGAMDRLPPLAVETQTAEQREAIAEVTDGPRGALVGPFVPLSRAPELMRRLQRVGEHFRWGTCSLPDDVRELAVLMVARHWDQQVEWALHRDLAERAGVPAEVCDAVSQGRRPALGDALEGTYDVVAELLVHRAVSDVSYARAIARLGEQGIVELVSLAGYYTTLAMVMNTARTPVPDGPSLPPLR